VNRALSILTLFAFLVPPLHARAEDAGAIYTWTDSDGVIHFGDAPPSSGATTQEEATPSLDESTPVPATLNELFGEAAGDGATSDMPADAGGFIAPPVRYQPGSGSLTLQSSGADPSAPVPVEALDALDPIWFRGGGAESGEAGYVDEHGPYTFGEPMEDFRAPPPERCAAARRDLAVLRDDWPVYRDEGGRLRFQWARDPYRGSRRYLDPAARANAAEAASETIERDCETPDDPRAQRAARDRLMHSALCEAERAELAALESLGGDEPAQALTDKRTLAAEVCGAPAPQT
jgi:hypothetical protein